MGDGKEMIHILSRYLKDGEQVGGWLDQYSAEFISHLSLLQNENKIVGSLGEIGVHMGRLFIILKLTAAPDERTFAIDIFDDQHLNVDKSGFADKDIFKSNLRHWTGDDHVEIIQSPSDLVTPEQVINLAGQCRLLSID